MEQAILIIIIIGYIKKEKQIYQGKKLKSLIPNIIKGRLYIIKIFLIILKITHLKKIVKLMRKYITKYFT